MFGLTATPASGWPVPVLPRRRHEVSEPVEELKWGKLDDAAGARARGLPPAPRADPVGRLVPWEHVADAGLLDDLNAMGLLFESLAVRDLRVYADGADAGVFHYRDSTNLEIDAIVERRDGAWLGIEVKLGGEGAVAEAVANLAKLRSRLTEAKLAQLASLCVITGGQTSLTRPDCIHVIALAHLRP